MRIWWHKSGPLLSYDGEFFHAADLNPTLHLRWQVSRWELVKIGFGCVWAAIRSERKPL